MKKLFGIFTLIAFGALGQDIDTLQLEADTVLIDSVEKVPPPYYGALYIDVSYLVTPNVVGQNGTSMFGIGVQYQRWSFGFYRFNIESEVSTLVIFPNAFDLNYRYGGLRAGFECYDSKWIDVGLQLFYGKGEMTWWESANRRIGFGDRFDLSSVNVIIEMDRIRYVKPLLIVGYQKMNNLALPIVVNNDFSGPFFGIGLKVGYFNQ